MLKGISKVISPELLKVLMEMGHGDEIVLADANFPAASIAHNLIRLDGVEIPVLLKAILALFPLDHHTEEPVLVMAVDPHDAIIPEIWQTYQKILDGSFLARQKLGFVERYDFYARAKKAYAIVATGEESLYANLMLKKGVIK